MTSDLMCFNCGARTTNGLALCDLCQTAVAKSLEYLPIHFANLARWRPSDSGTGRPVPGSRWPSNLTNGGTDRVSEALDYAGNDILGWARMVAEDRGVDLPDASGEAEQVAVLCQWLTDNLASVALSEWCGDFATDVFAKGERQGVRCHERYLAKLSNQCVPGWYAGGCRLCGHATYVLPGLTWTTCQGCGAATYARDHVEIVLREARGWLATPKRLAEALVALIDTEQSVERLRTRISKWATPEQRNNDGKVTRKAGPLADVAVRMLDIDGDPVGPRRVYLGDVMDILTREGATPLTTVVEDKAEAV